ncbi:MAG: DUF2059 domain-containing protein [Moraxellaceae bacterium]|nr:MAG: DUF2059 domain-containing protein [Moraxellaceae bacterium]
MFKKILCALLLALGSTGAIAAPAQVETVEKLLVVVQADQTINQVMTELTPQLQLQANQIVQHILEQETLNHEQQAVADKLAVQMLKTAEDSMNWNKLKPRMVNMYTSIFSEEEIQAQLDFYSSSVGQSIMQKMPQVIRQSMEITMVDLQENMQNFMGKDMEALIAELMQLQQGTAEKSVAPAS